MADEEKLHPILRKSHRFRVQFRRSIVSSVLGFATDAGLLALLKETLGVHYLIANAASFVVGSTVVYALSHAWVFPSRPERKRRLSYLSFILLSTVGLCLNSLLMWLLTDKAGLWYLASKLAAACVVFFFNFACRKFLVFRSPGSRAPGIGGRS